jgi:hypothetical protein
VFLPRWEHLGGNTGIEFVCVGVGDWANELGSLSEYFGRNPIYIVSYGIFLLYLVGTALVKNLGGFLALSPLGSVYKCYDCKF